MLSSQMLCPSSCSFCVALMGLLLRVQGRADALPRDLRDRVGREPELLYEHLELRRSAEGVHSDDRSAVADVAMPTERRCLLDRDPGLHRGWQDGVSIELILTIEELRARHAHHTGADAVARELLPG